MGMTDFIKKTKTRGRKKKRQQGYIYHTYSTEFKTPDCEVVELYHYGTKILEYDLEKSKINYFRSTSHSDTQAISKALWELRDEGPVRETYHLVGNDRLLVRRYKVGSKRYWGELLNKKLITENGRNEMKIESAEKIISYSGDKRNNYFIVKDEGGDMHGWDIKSRCRSRLKIGKNDDGYYLINGKWTFIGYPESYMSEDELKKHNTKIVTELL